MQGLLSLVAGRHLTVEQANSEQLSGKLIQAKSDYLTILDQNGVLIHIQFSHIVSVVLNHAELVLPLDEVGIDTQPTFVELLRSLSGQIIRVEVGNRMNDGVIYQVNDKEISLILDMKHTIYYPISQIQRFSLVQNSDKLGTSNEKNEDKTDSNVTKNQDTHKDKSEGNAVANTLVVQEGLVAGGNSSFSSEIAITESTRQKDRKKRRNPISSKPTVFHVKWVDDFDKGLKESEIVCYIPIPTLYEQNEIVQSPQIQNRHQDHASAAMPKLFHSRNKQFGNQKSTRHKFS